jgi:hypothetical protein
MAGSAGAAGGTAAPWLARGAAFALRGAYRAIADAQVLGSSSYLDAAKNHYRGALARYARQDAGAAAEAMAAAALARAATAEHPAPAPKDIPPPPAVVAGAFPAQRPDAPGPGGMRGGPPPGMPDGPRPSGGRMAGGWGSRGGFGGRFDPTRLAADAKLAGTAEARELAQKAVDADVARTRAAYSGNLEEASRQGRLANDLALAVRSLARADHPPPFNRRMAPSLRRRPQQTPGGTAAGS